MSADGATPSGSAWADACAAARLLALDPVGIGGIRLRAPAGPARDRWLALLRDALRPGTPTVRLPLHASDERLLGGLDLTATLRAGKPVFERGLLAAADGGVVLLPMAERLSAGTAARIAAALDTGEVAAERDGFAIRSPARFAVAALDEGIGPDEQPPVALTERLALHVDLSALAPRAAGSPDDEPDMAAARALWPRVTVPDDCIEALCAAALAAGIGSLRAPILAARVARAAAALAGRESVAAEDAGLAARLVLAPRATRVPATEEPADPASAPDREPSPEETSADRDDAPPSDVPDGAIDDVVLAALAASIPAGLLDRLRTSGGGGRPAGQAGSGAQNRDKSRGRPAGTLRGEPRRGARLDVVETLRAAAPWQALRRDTSASGRLSIRRDDLRIRRFKRRTETTTIFVVDASGSSAFHRLAEAKGAVELLLADCYIRRDRVALMAFRGKAAELLLPPTRSLTRAKRGLAALPGGGGTPLASAIDAASDLAGGIKRSGGSAVVVFLTDGRANIARDGQPGRERAGQDARGAARRLRTDGATVLFIDTSPRPHDGAAEIAAEMGARYLALPAADAASLSGVVRREMAAGTGAAKR